ncbi:hypothetical protein D3C86_1433230 [compost metagenome]
MATGFHRLAPGRRTYLGLFVQSLDCFFFDIVAFLSVGITLTRDCYHHSVYRYATAKRSCDGEECLPLHWHNRGIIICCSAHGVVPTEHHAVHRWLGVLGLFLLYGRSNVTQL